MRRAVLAAGVLAFAAGACAIQPDREARDIPGNQRVELALPAPEAGAAGGSRRIYLVADEDDSDGGQFLRPVVRNVDPGAEAVLDELFNSPNQEELDAGIRTDIPDTLVLRSARRSGGTLIVDVSPEILELSGPTRERAVAQIVFTASELTGVRDIRLRVDGEDLPWPDGRGELQTDPLTGYDYPGFVPSTQPAFPAIPSETQA